MMWLLLAACTDEAHRKGECLSPCGVDIELDLPQTTADDRLVVRTAPGGYALGVELSRPGGGILAAGSGVGELELALAGALEEGVEYTLAVQWACTPGEVQPACEEDRWTFEVDAAPPPYIEDVLLHDVSAMDILWVVDNSCSMADEQDRLAESFPLFLDYVLNSGIDYHVGVVSTDLDNPVHGGKLRSVGETRWIEPGTPSPEQVFGDMVRMGTTGSGTEKGIGATFLALEAYADTFNRDFLRPDSDVHVIIVSDEADQTDPTIVATDEFIDWFEGLRPSEEDTSFHAIVSPGYGSRYIEVHHAVGGTAWDITSGDWASAMEGMGIGLSGRIYCLTQQPDPSSVEVTVVDPDGNVLVFEEGTDWIYDAANNCIAFLEFVPTPGSEIHLRYLPR